MKEGGGKSRHGLRLLFAALLFVLFVLGAALLWGVFLLLNNTGRASGEGECPPYDFSIPAGFAAPPQGGDNCLNPSKIELGRLLFYEKGLSINGSLSCGGCHIQEKAFSDGRARARGATKMVHPRNAPGLANVAFFDTLTWAAPGLGRLENQALNPLLAEAGLVTIVELGMSRRENVVIERLSGNEVYRELFEGAFGDPRIDVIGVVQALEAFEMTLLSYQSPYDRGEMGEGAKRGWEVFEAAGCKNCHGGINFNEPAGYEGDGAGLQALALFRNVGLYNIGGRGDYPDYQIHGAAALRKTQGLYAVTGDPRDRGKFRIPSLRNVALTPPYMHDGSVATLEEAIEVFNSGGRHIESGSFAGDGRESALKDPLIRPLGLSSRQKEDLAQFLRALSDECFINNPALSDPSQAAPVMPDFCEQ